MNLFKKRVADSEKKKDQVEEVKVNDAPTKNEDFLSDGFVDPEKLQEKLQEVQNVVPNQEAAQNNNVVSEAIEENQPINQEATQQANEVKEANSNAQSVYEELLSSNHELEKELENIQPTALVEETEQEKDLKKQNLQIAQLAVKNSESFIANKDLGSVKMPIEFDVAKNTKNTNNSKFEVKYESLGQKLLKKKLISQDQLDLSLKIQRTNRKNTLLGQILVENGFITESALNQILVEGRGVGVFNAKESLIDQAVVIKVPKDVATKIQAVPIMMDEKSLHIIMVDIYDLVAIDTIKKYFPDHLQVLPMQCLQVEFSEIITNYYQYDLSIAGILKEIEKINKDELIKVASDNSYVNPTVRLVDVFLFDAIRIGASDIHLEPEGLFVRVRYRIDGVLQIIRSFHIDYWSAVVVRIKIISGMNIAESRIPQDGRITYNAMGRKVDFRVATHPTIHGENIVLRLLDKNKAILPMVALGYSDINVERLKRALKRPEGIIIVTGPTGSGKSTTLYSIINFINTVDVNIMTIEDPVEYQLSMIRQTNIREGGPMDFAKGIKSSLRQDPDIIFVGEVRDQETATLALRAAMTGHRVFTTLHTNDAIGSITRLMDIGVNGRILSENIVACIAQRLTRKLCVHCKLEKIATPEECKLMKADPSNPPKIYTKVGCEKCNNSGYKGRLAISEILLIDSQIAEMIAKNETKNTIMEYVNANGFVSMVDDGVDKVLNGILDLEELIDTVDLTSRM